MKSNIYILTALLIPAMLMGCSKKEDTKLVQEETELKQEAEESVEVKEGTDTEENTPESDAAEEAVQEEKTGEAQSGELSEAELLQIEKDFNEVKWNGFLQSEYQSPERIYWDEALYNGGGIETSASDELIEAYLKEIKEEELLGDLTVVETKELEEFVEATTKKPYSDAVYPISWTYLTDYDAYVLQHGDTNYMEVKLISGEISDGIYSVVYEKGIYDDNPVSYEITFTKEEDGYCFRSNLWKPEGKDRETAAKELYDEVIKKYIKAINDRLDGSELESSGLSYLCSYAPGYYGDGRDPLEEIGCYYEDVDGDGIDELFIGKNTEDGYIETIYQAFSIEHGQCSSFIDGGERERYYLAPDKTFYCEASESAFRSSLVHSKMEGPYRMLMTIDGVVYNSEPEEETGKGPYFYTTFNLWDTNMMEPINEESYSDYMKKAQEEYVNVKYTPFIEYSPEN